MQPLQIRAHLIEHCTILNMPPAQKMYDIFEPRLAPDRLVFYVQGTLRMWPEVAQSEPQVLYVSQIYII